MAVATGAVEFIDCDVLGRLRLEGSVSNPPDWEGGGELTDRKNGERLWTPRQPRGLRLEFTNLDGKTDRLRVDG